MSTATTRWNRVSRRPLADVLDELRTARTLTFDEHGPGVVVMSVNRPHRANSQTVEMFGEIAWAAATLRNAPLRALIITGAGGKAFCTGFDLDEVEIIARLSVPEFTDLVETAAAGSTGMRALPYPVIAAVSGPAAGGGLSLALAADIRIADQSASFSAGFVRVGLSIGELGTSWNLVRLIGPGRAAEMAYTGRTVRAAEAVRIGLADRLTETGTALDAAIELARNHRRKLRRQRPIHQERIGPQPGEQLLSVRAGGGQPRTGAGRAGAHDRRALAELQAGAQ